MTDPLSIAASVAGLALLARDIAKGIKEVKSALKGSGAELTGLYNGVISLYSVLQGAQLVMEQMDDYFLRDTAPGDIVFACNDTFEAIHKLLKKYNLDLKAGFASTKKIGQHSLSVNAKGRWGTLKQATRWYLNKEEVEKLCADLESHKTKLALAMSRDSMTALVEVLKSQNSMSRHMHDMRKIQAEIRAGQIQESKRQLNETQARMMKDFSDVEPQEALKKHLQLRQQGTGAWFLEGPHFQNFLSKENSSLLLYGIPGAGKSVLSATISEFINDLRTQSVAAAFFFCEHDYPETQGARNILASLAKQLAIQNDDAFSRLEAYYKEHTSFEKLSFDVRSMLNLLWNLSKAFDTTLIVVDGLDECLEDRTEMVQILSKLCNPDESTIKTLFSSRNESDIRKNLVGFQNVEIKAAESDVRLHVAAQLESPRFRSINTSNTGLKEEILQYLVENSGGMLLTFKHASRTDDIRCQLDYLHSLPSNGMRRKALKQLPPDLPRTYERILLRAKDTARGDIMLSYLERTLRWIAFAARPLSVAEMSHTIAVEQGDTIFDDPMDMEKILCHYSSLVREDDGILTFSHFSVKEYLTSIGPDAGPLARFRLDEGHSHGYLAETCLTYLLLEQFDQEFTQSEEKIRGALEENPFYRYASHYWTYHARNSAETSVQTPSLVKRLFEPQKSNNFVLWAYSWILYYVYEADPAVLHLQMADVNPLHLACLCGLSAVIDSLIHHGQDVNQRSRRAGTPLDCIGGAFIVPRQEKGLPRPEDRKRAAERLLQEGVVKESPSMSSAVRGAILHGDAPLLTTLLDAGCPLIASDISLAMGVGSDSIIHALRQAVEKRSFNPGFELPESSRLLIFGKTDYLRDKGHGIHHPSTPDIVLPHLEDEYQQMMVLAATKGQLSRIKQILSGLQSLTGNKRKDFLSDIVLHASHYGHTEVVEHLVKEGADVFYQEPLYGQTALHFAAYGRHIRLTEKLLKLSPAPRESITIEDSREHYTPWMIAIYVGSVEILKLFLEVDPSLDLKRTSKFGFTAMNLAISSGNRSMFWFLEKQGLGILRAADSGRIPLHQLLDIGRGELELPGEFARFVINAFLHKESDISKQSKNGDNTLHVLFRRAAQESTHAIWQAIANEPRFKASRTTALQTGNRHGATPLHNLMEVYIMNVNTPSITTGISEIIQSVCNLEGTKAALATKNSNGQTPLLLLAEDLSHNSFPDALSRTQSDVLAKTFRILIEADRQDHCLNETDSRGRTVLHWIAECTTGFPFEEIAGIILQYPVNLSARDSSGATPLEIALSNENHTYDLFHCLMESASKVDLESRGQDGNSILHTICALRKDDIEDLLSLYLSDIALSTSKDNKGRIPLMYTPEVVSKPSLAYQLIDIAKENVNMRDNEGDDVLSHACRIGSTVMLEALIQHDTNIDEGRGVEGREDPPIVIAAESRKMEVVQLLLNSGADPYVRGRVGDQLHHWAVTRDDQSLQDIVETLEGFDYNEKLSGGWTIYLPGEGDESVPYTLYHAGLLHLAALNEDPQALRWLLQPARRPRNLDQETGNGETALFAAAYLGILTNCKTLVSAGATVSKTRSDGCTAFDIACQYGHTDLCDFLLSVDESLACVAPASGTPLQTAIRGGHIDVVRLLLSRDIKIPDGLETEALVAGKHDIAKLIRSRLQYKRHQQTEMNTWTEREINTLQLSRVCEEEDEEGLLDLLEAGIYPNRRVNDAHETALHIASKKGWVNAVKALVQGGSEIDSFNLGKTTPLILAAENKQWEVAKTLCSLGARLDFHDIMDMSVLHFTQDDPEMMAYFLENGSDATSGSYFFGTPLMGTTNPVCMELLLQHGCDPFAITVSHVSAVSEICDYSSAEEALRNILSERPVKRMFDVIDLRDLEMDSTPLYHAAFCGRVGNILALIEHGADVNLPGGFFGTPYQAALKQGHVKALTLLAENGAKPCMVIRNGQEHAAWFWEHGGQFSFPAPDGTWVPTSLPLWSKKPPRRIRVNDARKGRYWEHGYRFSFQNQGGTWIVA